MFCHVCSWSSCLFVGWSVCLFVFYLLVCLPACLPVCLSPHNTSESSNYDPECTSWWGQTASDLHPCLWLCCSICSGCCLPAVAVVSVATAAAAAASAAACLSSSFASLTLLLLHTHYRQRGTRLPPHR
jgi:ABC-type spermidine/putrescine transport system permease subunit II